MKRSILLLTLLSIVGYSQAQDDCASAIIITAGLYTVDTVDGPQAPEPNCSGTNNQAEYGEWYEYTPTDDFSLTVSTDLEQNSGGDTRFHIYSGSCGDLSCVGGDDDGGVIGNGYLSLTSVAVYAGETYYIAFDNAWNALGFDFLLTESDPVFNPISFIPGEGSGNVVVDMDGDARDDLVRVIGNEIRIMTQQEDGTFVQTDIPTSEPDFNPSWSTTAGDLDGNGRTDLMYGGGSGVTFMMANDDGTGFTEISGPEYVFCQRTNLVDINNDGNLDAFSCHDVQPNVYYLNDGEGNLIYFQGGLGDTPDGGNYGSVWIDYDNDGKVDLFIAKCRGGNVVTSTNQMHKNMGNGVFQEVALDLNLADPVQTWSSAWGDFDNDGDMDVFVGASSMSAGGHRLMRNDDFLTFTDVTVGSGFDTSTGTSIENCTQDFNNDGYLDILGAGGTMWLNNGDMTFTQTGAGVSNGPIGDLNGDGFLDVVSNGTVYFNAGNQNNYLRVHLQGVESNSDGIGARVECVSALGTQIRDIRAGEGFRYMSSLTAHFGIAQDEEVEQILVHWPSGNMDVISNPQINTTLVIVEGSSTAVGLSELNQDAVSIYPSVTERDLNINVSAELQVNSFEVFDNQGRKVMTISGNERYIDVAQLAAGQYTLRATIADNVLQHSFVKR